MTIGLLIAFAVVFFVANLAARAAFERIGERRRRRELEQALAVSLKLDFTLEAKSLKRVEVTDPVARILCVDDEAIVLDSFRKILVLDGYAVDTVETGQEALGLIQTHQYDFVFTDLRMPGMDGVEVVKAVKHTRPDIDIVIITGYATVETAVECMKHGAMDYVQKPFTEDELRAFVNRAVLKRKHAIARRLKPTIHITHGTEPGEIRANEFFIPGGVLVSKGHCWASVLPDGSVKVGMDDFAQKLIGRVDAIEMPPVGASVKVGQPLFAVRQKTRRLQFLAPVSGKVIKVNQGLNEAPAKPGDTPYHNRWISVIGSENLDAEIRALKIGKSAEALFEEDIEGVTALMHANPETKDEELCIGAFERLDDAGWEKAGKRFFQRTE